MPLGMGTPQMLVRMVQSWRFTKMHASFAPADNKLGRLVSFFNVFFGNHVIDLSSIVVYLINYQ